MCSDTFRTLPPQVRRELLRGRRAERYARLRRQRLVATWYLLGLLSGIAGLALVWRP